MDRSDAIFLRQVAKVHEYSRLFTRHSIKLECNGAFIKSRESFEYLLISPRFLIKISCKKLVCYDFPINTLAFPKTLFNFKFFKRSFTSIAN